MHEFDLYLTVEVQNTMRNHEYPDIGHWYQDGFKTSIFEVVALDIKGGVEIQYFDGEIEELDLDSWYELELVEIPAPEDWSGPFEMVKEDLDLFDEPMRYDLSNPLDDIEFDEDKY